MTRLRDALEKASSRTGAAKGEAADAPHFTDPVQLVSDCWNLDGVEEPIVADNNFRLPDPFEPGHVQAVAAAPDRVEAVPPPAERNRAADVWATYRFGKEASTKVVVGPDPNPALVEQYRRLGAALHHHQLQGGAHTLMVTSAVASEGKTLTATNLALTLSHSYKRRVLLIDADLRRPSVHDVLGLPNTVGLTDALRHSDRSRLRFHKLSPMLSVVTAGRPDSDPMAGLVSETMSQILTEAAAQFDWVIVDTPPVALLPDANLLAAMIDTALLVVSANATPYPLVARAVQAIGEQRILGVVLNRMAHSEMIGAYNYYGYGGHYYSGGAPKPSLKWFTPFLNRHKKPRGASNVRE
ncbi:MAG: ywqD 1 [Acidobacteria bacterium]|nr:ywqD 1 [Acidobacteriota bacterium]